MEDAAGKPISFLFGYPDPWTASAGRATRFVAKTLATAPSARGQGLARHLFDRLRQAAGAKGHRQIVHALLHVDNRSRDVSLRHESRLFRRYALYQWTP